MDTAMHADESGSQPTLFLLNAQTTKLFGNDKACSESDGADGLAGCEK
jgi:hypothetical protein